MTEHLEDTPCFPYIPAIMIPEAFTLVTLQAVHPVVRGCAQRPNLPQGRVIPPGIWRICHTTGSISRG